MSICGLHPSSAHPPALSADDAAAAQENLPFVLVELKAYVAKRDNATTAFSETCDGKKIQVTCCLRRPPRVSYVCVHSPDAAEINMEPTVLATEEGFILIRVTIGAKGGQQKKNIDYYVYQADGAGGPSLTLLPRPPTGYSFNASNIGILVCRPDDDDQSGFFLQPHRPDDNKGYIVEQGNDFAHINCKVIAIGGRSGTMAFVDLWRGIIFCDVCMDAPLLSYVKLPEPLKRTKILQGDSRLCRDIAVVGNRLKYVELQVRYKASVVFKDHCVTNGWVAAIWSRPASSVSTEGWQEQSWVMDATGLKVDSEHLNLLPKVQNDEGCILPPFLRVYICQPVLGLGDGKDIIYFTVKRNRGDADGWVVSVDLENKEVLGVAPFAAQRYIVINHAYMSSRISRYMSEYAGD
ncbi:hypothetical protein PVAP13_4KG119000 [Panicum virgatum]|uniref:DUF1618 domain-containing protein n=1 Tax=Panicum virgatum TaxID=38727 RepID=A0A8T0TQE9_PANVG|nr:hypothetical protein PVAP13_4KG119000 [Panicum virgatum]